jgi:hypothetical protein
VLWVSISYENSKRSFADNISFGAVLEEFEVRDSIENVFSTKPEPNMVF